MSRDSSAEFDGIRGPVVHCTDDGQLEVLSDALVLHVDGVIRHVGVADSMTSVLRQFDMSREHVLQLNGGPAQFAMPGLVDTHIHACQYPNLGLGQDLPLLRWLDTYTFPLERRFADEAFAAQVYRQVVARTLGAGTTCASYMATIHRPATELLARQCLAQGQRALVGKTCMDSNCPPDYCETTEDSVRETRAFIASVQHMTGAAASGAGDSSAVSGASHSPPPLVRPSVTPRFAVSCSQRLLSELGALAEAQSLHVQSHLSENSDEVRLVGQLFPAAASYADVYRSAGLLGPRSLMAHCVHLQPCEMQLLAARGVGVAHCANSNITLMSGLCDVNRLEKAGIHVGLGTDVSGGNQLSMLSSMRSTMDTSKVLAISGDIAASDVISYRRAFYQATLGGARALALHDEIGNFSVGKQFDCVVVDLARHSSTVDLFGQKLSATQLLEKFITLGGATEIDRVFVGGRNVVENT